VFAAGCGGGGSTAQISPNQPGAGGESTIPRTVLGRKDPKIAIIIKSRLCVILFMSIHLVWEGTLHYRKNRKHNNHLPLVLKVFYSLYTHKRTGMNPLA